MYVFNPYTSLDTINLKLGFVWKGAKNTLIDKDVESNLLVFVRNMEVVEYVMIRRGFGDFYKIKSNGPFLRSQSSFLVQKGKFGDQNWIFLYKH